MSQAAHKLLSGWVSTVVKGLESRFRPSSNARYLALCAVMLGGWYRRQVLAEVASSQAAHRRPPVSGTARLRVARKTCSQDLSSMSSTRHQSPQVSLSHKSLCLTSLSVLSLSGPLLRGELSRAGTVRYTVSCRHTSHSLAKSVTALARSS